MTVASAADPRCPVCGGKTKLYGSKNAYGQAWNLHRCRACGHGFVSNRPSIEQLVRIYSTEVDHFPMAEPIPTPAGASADGESAGDEDEKSSDADELVGTLAGLARDRGLSLDVGSGGGNFSRALARRGFQPVMIDLDPRAERAAATVRGGQFFRSSFEELPVPGPFSAILMSQVLEHALDPMNWLRRAAALLSPGGAIAVALPNFGGVYRMLGMRDPFINPPVHLNYFTRQSLNRAFEVAGLKGARFETRSGVALANPSKSFSWKRKAAGRAWNAGSWVLNPTPYGIMLRGFAVRP